MRDFIAGKKTYILAALALLIAIAELFGLDVVPNIDQANAFDAIWTALAAATIRAGSKADAQAAVERRKPT